MHVFPFHIRVPVFHLHIPAFRSNPRFRFHRGVPCCYHPHCIHRSARAGHEIIPPSRPSPSGEGKQRSGRLPATGAVQYPDCSPTAHHPFWVEGKLSRPLARTAEWIVFRGNAHPVVAVAHRIGHPRQFTRRAMYAADGSCGRTMHRVPTSAEPETIGLEEIGGSTGAGSERTKIFAV
jgi:hypothetical protein